MKGKWQTREEAFTNEDSSAYRNILLYRMIHDHLPKLMKLIPEVSNAL
jgi:hypothetical protein